MITIYFTEIDSPIGVLSLRGTERGLTGIFMETHRHGPAEAERLGWQRNDSLFTEARTQLTDYFAGSRRVFALPIDRDALVGTTFQRRVWLALEGIPYGVTVSYGELARRIEQPAA